MMITAIFRRHGNAHARCVLARVCVAGIVDDDICLRDGGECTALWDAPPGGALCAPNMSEFGAGS